MVNLHEEVKEENYDKYMAKNELMRNNTGKLTNDYQWFMIQHQKWV